MRLTIIDNHDSFTYNLAELCRQAGCEQIDVVRNDEIRSKLLYHPDKLIISPGPGLPSETINLYGMIKKYAGNTSILGICLGFQAIVEVYGGTLRQLDKVHHGIVTYVNAPEQTPIFKGLESPFPVGRYHSWCADLLPECLEITAWADDLIMGIRHRQLDVQGLQFHPESFLTPSGKLIIENWLNS